MGSSRHAAFERLFTNHFALVYRYVRYQVPTDQAAIDVVYLVFYRLWSQQVVLDPCRPAFPYLYVLARCALIDYFRHEEAKGQLAAPDRHVVEPSEPPPEDPEPELQR